MFTKRIAGAVLGPPGPPGGGEPPFGFSDDHFRGRRVYIDPEEIRIVFDRRDGEGKAVLFPAILDADDPEKRTQIWVKAGLGVAPIPSQERESVEEMLKEAFEGVKSEKDKEKRKTAEDEGGRVQISFDTIAGFAETQQAAQQIILGSI